MRVFLILLLLANLGYFGWRQGWISEPAEPAAATGQAPFMPAGQQLVLLSELPATRRELMRSLAAAQAARAQSQQQMQQLEGEAAAVVSEIGEVQEQLAEDQARSAETQQALLDTLDAAIAGADVPAETNIQAETEAETATEADAQPEGPLPSPWCARAGIFPNESAAAAFMASLSSLDVQAAIEARQEPVSSTWWVYMPAFPSEAQAMAMLAELQAKNIDSYYMRSGEMAGGISLGVFSRQESALIEQQRKADQGYATSIREVFRLGERLYVNLAMPDQALREAPEWTEFLASAGGVELVEIACEMIASENEFP